MIELIKYTEKERWNEVVFGYKNNDIYYTNEYVVSFMENEDGIPYLLSYEQDDIKLCYPIIEKDISKFYPFNKILEQEKLYDWSTPYGYGGPLSNKEKLSKEQQQEFKKELYKFAQERNIVSQFLRFHPLLQNHLILKEAIDYFYIKDTIFINLATEDDLMVQMESKNRNMIRKAVKNGIEIRHDKGTFLKEFIDIYSETMDRDHARDFYYFPKSYYHYILDKMGDNTEFFYAYLNEKIIASAIFFYNDRYMHYHLSGSLNEYMSYAPTNLLLYEAANWGRKKELKKLHLGGGVGVEDGLFNFKKKFNKEGRIKFCIGRSIFLPQIYKELLDKRKKFNKNFDINNDYCIQYRKAEV